MRLCGLQVATTRQRPKLPRAVDGFPLSGLEAGNSNDNKVNCHAANCGASHWRDTYFPHWVAFQVKFYRQNTSPETFTLFCLVASVQQAGMPSLESNFTQPFPTFSVAGEGTDSKGRGNHPQSESSSVNFAGTLHWVSTTISERMN